MLTISRLKRWSIRYYNDTATSARRAAMDRQAANGGLGEYYSEADTRTPTWLVSGDPDAASACGLDEAAVAGGSVGAEAAADWLDLGMTPNGVSGRAFGESGVHGFDLTFSAPKSVSLIRALTDEVAEKVLAGAHERAIRAAMTYLHHHAGYTRVHNPSTGMKDLQRLPGLVAIAYQHETSRCGDPQLHTHVILPNRQIRADGQLVSVDSKSLYHEAKAAGMVYQATLRHELHVERGFEWQPVDAHSGMAEIAGVTRGSITAWSRRSTRLREWARQNLVVVDGEPTAAQLAAAQKATRPAKPESVSWDDLKQQWRADARGLGLDRTAHAEARARREEAARARARTLQQQRAARAPTARRDAQMRVAIGEFPLADADLARMAADVEHAAYTRADMIEHLGARLPVDAGGDPRELLERMTDRVGIRLSEPRRAHHREGHDRFTVDAVMFEEEQILRAADAQDNRCRLDLRRDDVGDLSADQARAIANIATSPHLVQPLQAPAGAGKTHSLKALRGAAHRAGKRVLVCAPTGKAVDEALAEGAGDDGMTVAKALISIERHELDVDRSTLVVVDEAAMVGTADLRKLMACAVRGRAKIVLVGDAYQISPVKARGGMFEQLCAELPWSQRLGTVWRMRDPEERDASLALRSAHGNRLRSAVGWYRGHGRLHTGDPIAMGTDALAAYEAARASGTDALLVCDTWEMADALNRRLHDAGVSADAPSVRGMRDQRISVGDVILTRANDATIAVQAAPAEHVGRADQVRNGNRWRVAGVDSDRNRLAAQRLGDGARALFDGEYVVDHVTLGYAVTVHAAQGVTTDESFALLGERSSRAMAYVAMTRGRNANHAFVYQPTTAERDTEHTSPAVAPDIHRTVRGDGLGAVQRFRQILRNDDRPQTAHTTADRARRDRLPEAVTDLQERNARRRAVRRAAWQRHQAAQRNWHRAATGRSADASRTDDGLEL